MLTTKPPTQPPLGVLINRLVGRADLPQDEVVRPSGQKPVQAFYHDPGDSSSLRGAVNSLTRRRMLRTLAALGRVPM